ncbi:hypothetical protein K525DRAFT_282657 [Schizophyllum commune Loenen D]|nr:hypothetical protein K525DRAFT_282657 [Schizophyllum commune Loenen D]
MEPQDLAVTVTEDRRRGTIARFLGRSRTPSPRFFTARVNTQNVAAVARAMTNHRAMSPGHLDEAQSGDNDDPGDLPGHNAAGERSQRAISEASGESLTSPMVTNVPYPPTDSASRSNTASHTPPPTAQTDTDDASAIHSESDIESHSSPSGSTGSSALTLTASSPLSTFSIIRHSRVTQPLQFRGYLEDPGPSAGRSRTHAGGGDHRPSNATDDHTDTPIVQQRLESVSEDGLSSQEEIASQPPPPTEPAGSAPATAQAANQHVQKVNKGPFQSQLGDPRAEPFAQRLDDVFDVCEASQSFTELGGGRDGRDVFIQILLHLTVHLRNLRVASVEFHADDGMDAFDNISLPEQLSVKMALSSTTPSRLQMFPLRQLRVLEILSDITEATVESLTIVCTKLAVLEAGPHPASGFPAVLRIFSAHPCHDLLAAVPRNSVDLDFTLTDSQYLADVRKITGGNSGA